MKRILVFAAHPDDEVLGCGATIARHAANGDLVTIAIFAEGITSRSDDPADADASELATLHGQAQKAADLLGAQELVLFDFPDNRMDTVAHLDVIKRMEELVDRVQPQTIYIHHGGDLNVDHQVIFRAALTATRPMEGGVVREVLAFEVPSSTEWAFQQLAPVFRPNVFVDVSSTLDKKLEAMAMYDGESRPFPHPRSPEALRATAKRWGSAVGLHAAEAFQSIRCIR